MMYDLIMIRLLSSKEPTSSQEITDRDFARLSLSVIGTFFVVGLISIILILTIAQWIRIDIEKNPFVLLLMIAIPTFIATFYVQRHGYIKLIKRHKLITERKKFHIIGYSGHGHRLCIVPFLYDERWSNLWSWLPIIQMSEIGIIFRGVEDDQWKFTEIEYGSIQRVPWKHVYLKRREGGYRSIWFWSSNEMKLFADDLKSRNIDIRSL